jgi:hypothetical protein
LSGCEGRVEALKFLPKHIFVLIALVRHFKSLLHSSHHLRKTYWRSLGGNAERIWLEKVGVGTCADAERQTHGFGSGVAAIVRK